MAKMNPDWMLFLGTLADEEGGEGSPARIAAIALQGRTYSGRRDAKVRNAMEAMARRGWVRRSAWLAASETWKITEEGRKALADHRTGAGG